jgi:hypothetical protein
MALDDVEVFRRRPVLLTIEELAGEVRAVLAALEAETRRLSLSAFDWNRLG